MEKGSAERKAEGTVENVQNGLDCSSKVRKSAGVQHKVNHLCGMEKDHAEGGRVEGKDPNEKVRRKRNYAAEEGPGEGRNLIIIWTRSAARSTGYGCGEEIGSYEVKGL